MRRRLMKLPFAYVQQYVPYRRRDPRSVFVRGDLPVLVHECEGGEAPVGLTLERHDLREKYPDHFSQGAPVERFRYIGGTPFEPLGGAGEGISPESFQDAVAKPVDDWVRWGFAGKSYRTDIGWSPSKYPAMPWYKGTYPLEKITSPMEAPTAAEFAAWARDRGEPLRLRGDNRSECEPEAARLMGERIAVIDGAVWVAKPGFEPHWEVVEGSDDKVRLSLTYDREPLAYVHAFRIDRLSEARAFAKARAEALGREFEDCPARAVVADPGILRRDEAVEVMRQVLGRLTWAPGSPAASIISELDRKGESLTPVEAGEAYAMVRQGLEGGMVGVEPGAMVGLDRFAQMAETRAELRQEPPRDEEFLSGLGR